MFLKKVFAFFGDLIEVVVFSGAIFLVLYLLVLQPHKIKGSSMDRSFFDGEYLLTDKLTYRFGEPKRGDVVVFKAPKANGDEYIKRVIGLPLETVTIKDGKVFINGNKLVETYIDPSVYTSGGTFLKEGFNLMVPQGKYFVLGDNRPYSSDSRAWGFITKNDITGRAWVIYYPIKSMGVIKAPEYPAR
jgi:signal peptidase I